MFSRLRKREATGDGKFGTFAGVFTPTILTILGVIMYLRLGWVVGNAGLGGALIIILLAHLITVCTGLAVSSITTNTEVGAGGAFAIISQSLGLEIGGSVGMPLYFAQGISVALYMLGFAESFVSIFARTPGPWGAVLTNQWIVAIGAFLIVTVIGYTSAQFATRIQFVIMGVIFLSLVSLGAGTFTRTEFYDPQIWGTFSADGANFWATFAVYFPAVTGIMSGISMSGSLRNPRRAIPVGTMGAIVVGLVIYVALAIWISFVATPTELLQNSTIMVDRALVGGLVLGGMLGATFSSGLGSLVAAPRVMQALAQQRLLPYNRTLVRQTENGDPRPATLATSVIAFIALIISLAGGGLNAVAGIITMFFLIAYAMLNVVVLIEQTLNMVSFRPTFSIPRIVPFIGMTGCTIVMFLINPIFTIAAIIAVVAIYVYLTYSNLETDISDVRSGLFSSIAEWSAVKANQLPAAPERTWKPTVLVPVSETKSLTGSYRFLSAITSPQGAVYPLGIYAAGQRERLKDFEWLTAAFITDGIYARATLLEEEDFINGVRSATQILRHTFFRPNILFFNLYPDSDLDTLQALVDKTVAYRMGIVLLARDPVVELGREQVVNVWVTYRPNGWRRDDSTNIDLAILLAIQLTRNWNGNINLCMAVEDEALVEHAAKLLEELLRLARVPRRITQNIVVQAKFDTAIAQAPRADLNIFGLPRPVDMNFCRSIIDRVGGSCIFVRDSGDESIFA